MLFFQMLQCTHTFHKSCLEEQLQSKNDYARICCLQCGMATNSALKDLPPNFWINNIFTKSNLNCDLY